MEVKIKRLVEDAVIPAYAHPGEDAGLDLVATSFEHKVDTDCYVYGTGLAIEIPKGYVGLLFPRSSNRKTEAYLTNSVGVIDSGYRGEIMVSFKNRNCTGSCIPNVIKPYEIGNKIAQLIIIPYPQIELVEVDELSDTDRGATGHGDSGK